MRRFLFLMLALAAHLVQGYADEFPFVSTYEDWKSTSNTFVSYIDDYDQARVIFCGSASYSQDNDGQVPTVSEGMGYGLLLSYANNDQTLFDKFLRYVLATTDNYGCNLFDPNKGCLSRSYFLMPWQVNDQGQPFWYMPSATGTATYTSGSASDADFQIAWAVFLASGRVEQGTWANSTFTNSQGTYTYRQLFENMALQIRLYDIDSNTRLYTPGSQWGAAGTKVLYTGYFTPQAFQALDTVPAPDVSSDPPNPIPPYSPYSSLNLVFKNNNKVTCNIDYMAAMNNTPPNSSTNFIPVSGSTTNYTVDPVTTATAQFALPSGNYNNVTFQATIYGSTGDPIRTSKYFMEYNNGAWTVTDQGSTAGESTYYQSTDPTLSNNVYIFLTDPTIEEIDFKFSDVMKKSISEILLFQQIYRTGLVVNVINYDGVYPDDNFSPIYGYDCCRLSLWSAPYLGTNPSDPGTQLLIIQVLDRLLSVNGVKPYVMPLTTDTTSSTLPWGGIQVLPPPSPPPTPPYALGDWTSAAPPLDVTLMMAAYYRGEMDLYNALSQPMFNYQITSLQPQSTDPMGDSTPYYNATMILLAKAFFDGLLK